MPLHTGQELPDRGDVYRGKWDRFIIAALVLFFCHFSELPIRQNKLMREVNVWILTIESLYNLGKPVKDML